ncbi:MAG: SH3 domain-containing protein [Deltaproteobacteria bacterium]|nr:SH3 domain-containing protein [Deltaproteobacteria bacterium]
MRVQRFLWLLITSLMFAGALALAQSTLWVTSQAAKLKADKKASSETIATLAVGDEVKLVSEEGSWYKIRTSDGREGWMYRGRLSDSPPQKEVEGEGTQLFSALSGSSIQADEADTARSIRGLSKESATYAENQGTPAKYKEALDRVLSINVTEDELFAFLREGKIGEYAE